MEKLKPTIMDGLIQRRIDRLESGWGALIVAASTINRNGIIKYGPPKQAGKVLSNSTLQKYFPDKEVAFKAYQENRAEMDFLENTDRDGDVSYMRFWIRLAN